MTTEMIADYTVQLNESFNSLMRTFALLELTEIEDGRMEGDWTPKALLAHVAFWDDVQTRRMQAALNGESAQLGFVLPAETNDQRAAHAAQRAWDEVVATAEDARKRMIEFASGLDESSLTTEYPEEKRTLLLSQLLTHMVAHTRSHGQELSAYCGSMRRWTKAGLRAFLVRQHSNLMDCIAGMREQTIMATAMHGAWNVRDLLVHVLAWNECGYLVVKGWPVADHSAIQEWIVGEGESVDDVNARLLANRSQLDMVGVVDGLATVHRRLLRLFDKMNEHQLASYGDYGWGEKGELSGLYYGLALHDIEHATEVWQRRLKLVGQ